MRLVTLGLLATCGVGALQAQGTRVPIGDLKPVRESQSWGALKQNTYMTMAFNERTVPSTAVANSLDRALSGAQAPTCAARTGTTCLTDGFATFDYTMDWSAALQLNILGLSAGGSAGRKVFVHDLMFTKYGVDDAGNTVTWGAGVRLVIIATQGNSSANFSSLPAIAASAEFKYTEATYQIRTIGLSGPKIALSIPNAASYSIDTHVALMKAIDAVRDAANDTSTVVSPQLVSVTVRDDAFYADRLARDFALQAMANGKSCRDAKGSLQNGHLPIADAAIEVEYKQVLGRCDDRALTDAVVLAQLRAKFAAAGVRIAP